jgi:negative modulator of initiation of replication
MPTIEIDNDVLSELERASYLTGIPVGQIVRGLVIRPERKAAPNTTIPSSAHSATEPSSRDKKLWDFVQSPPFLAARNVVDLFLSLLSFLCKENPDRFGVLESMEGRKRKYISKSEQELESSGISVNPKRIPNTNYWAVTNNSTDNKKLLLRKALTLLGYGHEMIRLVPERLR